MRSTHDELRAQTAQLHIYSASSALNLDQAQFPNSALRARSRMNSALDSRAPRSHELQASHSCTGLRARDQFRRSFELRARRPSSVLTEVELRAHRPSSVLKGRVPPLDRTPRSWVELRAHKTKLRARRPIRSFYELRVHWVKHALQSSSVLKTLYRP